MMNLFVIEHGCHFMIWLRYILTKLFQACSKTHNLPEIFKSLLNLEITMTLHEPDQNLPEL